MDEGKLYQSHEDKGKADDDVDIHGCGVGDLGLVLVVPNEPHSDHSQTAGDTQTHPGHDLTPSWGLDQPEAHPGAGHDDHQWEVGPQEVEPKRPAPWRNKYRRDDYF